MNGIKQKDQIFKSKRSKVNRGQDMKDQIFKLIVQREIVPIFFVILTVLHFSVLASSTIYDRQDQYTRNMSVTKEKFFN